MTIEEKMEIISNGTLYALYDDNKCMASCCDTTNRRKDFSMKEDVCSLTLSIEAVGLSTREVDRHLTENCRCPTDITNGIFDGHISRPRFLEEMEKLLRSKC